MSFQMVLLQGGAGSSGEVGFGTMSFQMVLLLADDTAQSGARFGTMSFQMVLLQQVVRFLHFAVLELCHSRWFYYMRSLDAA